jgi:hypothetical protein
MKGGLAVIMFVLGVAALGGAYWWNDKGIYKNIKTQVECVGANNGATNPPACASPAASPDPGCCAVWQNNKCYKGKINKAGTKCEVEAKMGVIGLLALGVIFMLGFFYALFAHTPVPARNIDINLRTPDLITPNL